MAASFDPERHRIEDAIGEEPATDLRDLAAKILVLSGEGTWALPAAAVIECARLAGRDFDKLPACLMEDAAKESPGGFVL